VPGMQSARQKEDTFLQTTAARLQALGYESATWRLNAAAYGSWPQARAACL
jgi:hypothetical protein